MRVPKATGAEVPRAMDTGLRRRNEVGSEPRRSQILPESGGMVLNEPLFCRSYLKTRTSGFADLESDR